jgi:hypothetical protein
MPTYERLPVARAGYRRLGPSDRATFREALGAFIEDLERWEHEGMVGRPQFRAELRVKDVQMRKGIWELTWRWPDGRATFQYGAPVREGYVHVIWRRIGTHAVLRDP